MAVQGSGGFIRSPLARALYNRILEDQEEQLQDHSHWYSVNRDHLPTDLQQCFLQSHDDDETKHFLDSCYQKSDWLFTQIMHSLFKFILSWTMNKTSINGLLRRGSMFVFSRQQFQQLMAIEGDSKQGRLLDLGAGDGMVTKQMAPYFDEVFVTEMSTTMRWRLAEHGFKLIGTEEWYENVTTDSRFDLISCLNLLDRCDRPLDLLQHMRSVLKPTGRLLLAVVLPFSPYVETSSDDDHSPKQFLRITGNTFEEQVRSLTEDVLNPVGFQVERFTRLPYLCEGDLHHSFYRLTDVVLALKAV